MAGPAQVKGIEYLCQIETGLPDHLIADSQRIRKILINLVGNAIKFTEQGEVELSVENQAPAEDVEANTAILKFRIRDSGVGIREEEMDYIFDSFSQADNSTTRNFGGTGLGLAICKQLVEAMDGTIGVESTAGSGSEFYFTVPVQVADQVVDSKPAPQDQLTGRKVLVVDDNATNRKILQSHLMHWGASVDCSSDGREGLQKVTAMLRAGGAYDLLIIDYRMPEMDGREFASWISSDKQRYGEPVMIILSSLADEFPQIDLDASGISTCLNKPVLEDELYRQLCCALDGKRASDANVETTGEQGSPIAGHDILVVEDNLVNQKLIAIHLQEFGARVVISNNGEEALEQLNSNRFDLIVMDCQMPVMDGFEATRRIRAAGIVSKSGTPIPVLALTAHVRTEDKEECFAAGMDDYLAKPYEFSRLQDVLRRLLGSETTKHPQLDQVALDQIRELKGGRSANLLQRLIDVYLETSPDIVDDLARALEQKNAKAVREAAHSLKSSSATLGATRLAMLCRDLEARGRNAYLEEGSVTFKELQSEFELVCKALAAEKQKPG